MKKIALFHPFINTESAFKLLKEVLESKMIGTGSKVEEFEKEIENYLNNYYPAILSNKVVVVNAGTSALHIAFILAGIKEGDEIITPILNCTADAHAMLYLKAKPVFADIQKDTLNIDPEDIKRKITDKTKAIVVMYNGGAPVDMDEVMKIAKEHNLKVIEDACQAFGGEYKGTKLGTIADYGVYSFQAIKSLCTGDGGALICQNEEDYKKAKRLSWFGIDRKQQKKRGSLVPSKYASHFSQRAMTFDINENGYKYTMTDIMAAIGLANIEKISEVLETRRKFVKIYRDELKDVDGITLLKYDAGHSNWLFTILVNDREKFQNELGKHNIESSIVQVRNDVYELFGGKRLDLPNMNTIEDNYVSLPLHYNLTKENIYYICKIIKNIKNW